MSGPNGVGKKSAEVHETALRRSHLDYLNRCRKEYLHARRFDMYACCPMCGGKGSHIETTLKTFVDEKTVMHESTEYQYLEIRCSCGHTWQEHTKGSTAVPSIPPSEIRNAMHDRYEEDKKRIEQAQQDTYKHGEKDDSTG